ncbi:hypothetical protein CK203_107998 [Vitis vinifera]|uniref:Uncharacterized protein n=1 Tax=Vitis vinifera TaxID=29760 RepID=A0A438ES08_VITVI|nr:hypothetical protein CK203_107998 [Vitis vinifera]
MRKIPSTDPPTSSVPAKAIVHQNHHNPISLFCLVSVIHYASSSACPMLHYCDIVIQIPTPNHLGSMEDPATLQDSRHRRPSVPTHSGNADEFQRMYAEVQLKSMGGLQHEILQRVLLYYSRWSGAYGKTCVWWFGTKPRLAIADPESIKEGPPLGRHVADCLDLAKHPSTGHVASFCLCPDVFHQLGTSSPDPIVNGQLPYTLPRLHDAFQIGYLTVFRGQSFFLSPKGTLDGTSHVFSSDLPRFCTTPLAE